MRKRDPFHSNQTGVNWGVPSLLMVARFAKAFFFVRSSLNASGIALIA